MPDKLDRCVAALIADGAPEKNAWAVCRASLEMAAETDMEDSVIARAKSMVADKLKTYDIDGVEVFGVGEWNGRPFSARDLDTIVETFRKTKDRLKPYVKLGHDKDQPILKSDGLPAAGWVEDLARRGDRLVASLKRVPAKIKELIDAGAFRRVSIELIEKYRMGDQVYDMALAGLALLGAKTPAVDNLDDILALYGGACEVKAYESEAEAKAYTFDRQAQGEEKKMEEQIKALQAELAALKDKLAKSDAELADARPKLAAHEKCPECGQELMAKLAKAEAALKESQDQVAKFKSEARSLEITSKVDELIRQKKLLPAQKELAMGLLKSGIVSGELKFAAGGKEYKSAEELLFALIGAGSQAGLNGGPGESGAGVDPAADVKDGVSGLALDAKAKQYAKEHKVTYKDALLAVAKSGNQ